MRISEPGIYTDMSPLDYFSDPCAEASFTQSLAKIVLEKSPLHAWHAHPRLNPDYRHDDDSKFDVGNIAHKLMIGRGKEIIVLDQFDDWRTKEAKAKREHAAGERKIAVLGKHFALADRMVRAAREQLKLRGLGHFFRDGAGEVVMVWEERGFWCRQMLDWLIDRRVVLDYKTTAMSVAPHNVGRMVADAGWDIQAAMAERGLIALAPENPQKLPRRFLFIAQETEPPHCLTVVELSERVLTIGRKKLAAAMHVWNDCLAHSHWPGYPLGIVVPNYPEWAEAQWLDREQTEFADPVNILMAG